MRSRYMPWYTPTRSTAVSVCEGRITRSMSAGSSSARAASERTASSTVPGASMTACIHLWSRGRFRSRDARNLVLSKPIPRSARRRLRRVLLPPRLLLLPAIPAGLQGFGVDHLEGGDVGVPLEERRDVAGPPDGSLIELPDPIDDVIV